MLILGIHKPLTIYYLLLCVLTPRAFKISLESNMNTLNLAFKKDDIIDELKRESGGSFSIVYRALREVSQKSGGATSTSVNKAEVLREIHRLRQLELVSKVR